MLILLFAASLVLISRNYRATSHHANGNTPAEEPEDTKATPREESLLQKIAELKDDVQAANDDSTAWMELYHEQCIKNRSQSHSIERSSTCISSRLTYLDLKAQVQSSEIQCNWLRAQLHESDRIIMMKSKCEKQRQGKDRLIISNLQGRVRELLRHGRQDVLTTVQATELEQKKVESANLSNAIARKDQELQTASDKISRLEKENADNQVFFNKVEDDLNQELIQKQHNISKLQDKAAKDRTSSSNLENNLKQQLSVKNAEIERITAEYNHRCEEVERLKQKVTRLEACESDLNTSLSKAQAERNESQASFRSMEQKLKEWETIHGKCSKPSIHESRESETMAPTPSGLAPAASEGMDIDSPLQLLVESQKQGLDDQRQKIKGLEDSNRVLRRRLQSCIEKNEDHDMSDVSTTGWRERSEIEAREREIKQLRETVDELRRGDHDMSDAFGPNTQDQIEERVRQVTEGHSQTINMLNGQLASLQKENGDLKALAKQNGSLESEGKELLDAKITRLGKEKEDMNTNLQKARKLSENLKKERDQLREVKTKITHEKAELAKSQRKNWEELEKLREEKATLVEKCASLQKEVGELNQPHEEEKNLEETREAVRPNRKRSAPDDGEEKATEKRVKMDEPESTSE